MKRSVSKVWLNEDTPNDPYPLYAPSPLPPKRPGTIRVWVDGCFDMLHFGHANALRQARSMGDELFVGCHTDEEIIRHKGPPSMRQEERYEALRACKWVDAVIEGYPYVTRVEDMKRFEVDFVVHGDDISVDLNGRNSYQAIIDAGMFKAVRRTECISTTDLVGRMLLCVPSELLSDADKKLLDSEVARKRGPHYLTTSRKIAQFSNKLAPPVGATVVYVDGAFDLFHAGHIRFLQKARALGDYLIVGIHDDQLVRESKGEHFPIMSLNERALGVLSCRYVDDVVFGAPRGVTQEMIKILDIKIVACGTSSETRNCKGAFDVYEVPKSLNLFKVVESGSDLSTDMIVERVVKNHVVLLERQFLKHMKDSEAELRKPDVYRNVREV
ncbi:ethanolamine-phosphate cytidylyltransferase [Trypanosoma equiperdum]|uniref:Ethanolamine-phosphate cytidylyltransferase n=5 Tax=Trypanozoon TaxID=39700 RepID=Q382C3_TRYB2|nr:ethanolamine-phosphate cytidylyltransferase,putative [Trypanosoma brucei gambiense DAL972]XP_829470.1 ethanolamine-phosphate cytidylyltransferase, putative [Trypanosoma brucei brucei TREU927]RHW68179.1 ethanolamine-phosphate cytidylyltransferase [Trypanosoma brucei equiperdum]CAX32459.1 CTP-phosphoethanolamine cytidyltransferase [Trypanosoma brucei brucei]SCU73080.1 ethanolamine-phosphate cytidylyltransferase [Trypanosoma equiperdum]EAN80358.1 ethanolamine-phosphate cytidylyltransferase, pu|eukprot:XP_011780725.1 ethanolamine-phosphate cytidylyltransferase,putative [Trypanosoma brucei gambiense DAL972]